jgi:hypothetical protein
MRRRPFLAAAAGLALLVLLLFREALAGGVFYKRDIHLIWHPQVEGFVRAVAEGAVPVWDPSPAFGQPLLADPGAQVLYPPTWLNLVLKPWTYYTVFALGHVLLAALSFLALARRWRLGALASFTGAAAFVLSGPFLSLVDLWHHFAGASYIPAAFLFAEDVIDRGERRDVLRLGLVLGLQLLAGSGDASAMTLLALAAWGLLARSDPARPRAALVAAARGTAAGLVALAIGAGVWVAALDAASRSTRHSLPKEVRTYWSLHPAGAAETFLARVPSALPLDRETRARLYENREPFLASLYLGLPSLALAAFAWSPGARRRAVGLLLIGSLAVLLALGRHAPLYDGAVALLPPLGMLRYPVKTMILATLAWAGLVALGTEALRRYSGLAAGLAPRMLPALVASAVSALVAASVLRRPAELSRVLGIGVEAGPSLTPVGRGLAVHALLGWLAVLALLAAARARSRWGVSIAAVLVTLDLAVAHPWPNPVAPKELYTHRPQVLASLGTPPSARVYSYDYGETRPGRPWAADSPAALKGVPVGFHPDAASALADQLRLAPQVAGRWGVRQGFDADFRGLHAEPLVYFTRAARVVEDQPEALVRLLRIGAVTHIVALHDVAAGRLPLIAELAGLARGAVRAYAVLPVPARARVVGGARVASGLEAIGVVLDPDFDAETEVLLTEGRPHRPPAGFTGRARIVEELSDRVHLEVELSHEGYVVLADSHDPGWRATVDGHETPVLPANIAFRAVRVPPGRHRIEMAYRPRGVLVASLVSLVSLAGALGGLALCSRARSVPPMQP